MYLRVRGVSLPLSVIILVDFGTVPTGCFSYNSLNNIIMKKLVERAILGHGSL